MVCALHAGPDTEAQEREAENKRQFETLTEAAGELLDLGFEDIYQDSRETIAASLQGWAWILEIMHAAMCSKDHQVGCPGVQGGSGRPEQAHVHLA